MTPINVPTMLQAQRVTEEWTALPAFIPVPEMGVLAANAFLLKGAEPVLVDTGLAALGGDFMRSLEDAIDPEDLRWIWLSHADADHIGSLASVLERAPHARVVTSFLGMAKMGLLGHDLSRVHLLEPGSPLDLGDRKLVPVRPPYYDAPETLGFFDTRSGTFFAADSFGALLPEPAAEVAEIAPDTLRQGVTTWASIDAPWLAIADTAALGRTLTALRAIAPDIVLSAHLPVSRGDIDRLTGIVHDGWVTPAPGGPDPFAIESVATAFQRQAA